MLTCGVSLLCVAVLPAAKHYHTALPCATSLPMPEANAQLALRVTSTHVLL
jgi:hypothetical protein